MTLTITPAKRKRVPMLISLSGPSGSGKSYSALLLAAGLAGEKGSVGFLDTENGRASMYADSPGIVAALPNGYEIADLREPFAPSRYVEAVEAFESHGCGVLVIDSASHEWNGYGGCEDIAHNNKLGGMPNWALAKREHKKMMNRLLASSMHLVFCLRAQEKTAIVKDSKGKDQFVPKGIQPIQEKNFIFEMTLSIMLEEGTHKPVVTKCPEPLLHLFHGEHPLITKAMGQNLRAWAEAAPLAGADSGALAEQAIAYAAQGTTAYAEYWKGLGGKQQKELLARHDEFKELARMADERAKRDDDAAPPTAPEMLF